MLVFFYESREKKKKLRNKKILSVPFSLPLLLPSLPRRGFGETEKKVQAGQEEACSLVREGKRKKKRGAVKNERVSPSCFTLSFSSSFPTLSNPPLSPAMGIKVRLVSLRWSDGRLECVFA